MKQKGQDPQEIPPKPSKISQLATNHSQLGKEMFGLRFCSGKNWNESSGHLCVWMGKCIKDMFVNE